ncbi:MAG: DUF2917 domain-containing protein [Burkholderiales bacterium]|nr:DUF2917 domain-containing protein [Burkholderiales bacterium]
MPTLDAPIQLELQRRALFSVTDAAGVRIDCREGSVWITLDNDPRDIVLEAGGSFTTPEHRRALVYAMEASRLSVTGPAVAQAAEGLRLRLQPAMQPAYA